MFHQLEVCFRTWILASILPLPAAGNALPQTANGRTAPPTVRIAEGYVVGTTTPVPSATAVVNKYLGIPFAESPPERFSPPKDPKPFSRPLFATKVKPACIQRFNCKSTQPASVHPSLNSYQILQRNTERLSGTSGTIRAVYLLLRVRTACISMCLPLLPLPLPVAELSCSGSMVAVFSGEMYLASGTMALFWQHFKM